MYAATLLPTDFSTTPNIKLIDSKVSNAVASDGVDSANGSDDMPRRIHAREPLLSNVKVAFVFFNPSNDFFAFDWLCINLRNYINMFYLWGSVTQFH